MDQPGRRRRCGGGEIALLQQKHPQAASRGVARQADAVEPAADNSRIVVSHAGDSVSRVMSPLHLQRFQAKWRRLAKENASKRPDQREPVLRGAAASSRPTVAAY